MSFPALKWALRWRLNPRDRLTLIELADHHNDETQRCDPSVGRLAEQTGLSTRSIQGALTSLMSFGAIAVVGNRVGGKGLTSQYRLFIQPGKAPIKPPKGANNAPFTDEHRAQDLHPIKSPKGAKSAMKGCRIRHQRVQNLLPKGADSAPEPLREPGREPVRRKSQRRSDELPDLIEPLRGTSKAPESGQSSMPIQDTLESEFKGWWAIVPKKVDKVEAQKLFRQARTKKRVSLETIVNAMSLYAAGFLPVGPDDPRFATGPAKWLRGERWNDEAPAPVGVRSARENQSVNNRPGNGGGMLAAIQRDFQIKENRNE